MSLKPTLWIMFVTKKTTYFFYENDETSCELCERGKCSAADSTSCSSCDALPNGNGEMHRFNRIGSLGRDDNDRRHIVHRNQMDFCIYQLDICEV